MLVRLLAASLVVTETWAAVPSLSGYSLIWSDDFNGAQGTAVDSAKWNQVTGVGNSNGEVQTYTSNVANAHLSGEGQLYIIPSKSGSSWTSARLESDPSWAAPDGKATLFQAEIWVPDFTGSPANHAGLWPSFWTKGNANRNGVSWPKCGEWDIFEVTNKMSNSNQGTLHFLNAAGVHDGHFSGTVLYTGGAYHTWAFKIDRRGTGDWTQERLIWYLDGAEFYSVSGADVGTKQQWEELAWYPYFIILQVAIGGDYAGFPTDQTVSGYDASMRVRYTAVYQST